MITVMSSGWKEGNSQFFRLHPKVEIGQQLYQAYRIGFMSIWPANFSSYLAHLS